ncbi:hypothetical protein DITRI_Ditri13aG0023400 [Diplodiscus trichospermus]
MKISNTWELGTDSLQPYTNTRKSNIGQHGGDKKAVCVTGGTGYIGSWLIKVLLEQGYSVHATVRTDTEKKRDISFLTSLPGAAEKLKIFTADLNYPESFYAAIEGCKGVFHVATPVGFESNEPEEVLTKRSTNGTLGIFKACLKSRTVKKVVFTSSAAAVIFNDKDVAMMDENFWTDTDFARENLDPSLSSYVISKTLTERTALEFAAEHGLDLVTVIPSFVFGPFICPKCPDTLRSPLGLVLSTGSTELDLNVSMVHIDDVARAHIFLLEHPGAKGRYNCSSETVSHQKTAEIVSAKYPEFSNSTSVFLAEMQGLKLPGLSSKKLLDTGFKFEYGVEEMLDGTIKCCRERGYL